STGATGSTGNVGTTGKTGNTGSNGSTGSSGATGGQGNTGSTGSNGSDGTDGAKGSTGSTGYTGITGSTCPTGSGFIPTKVSSTSSTTTTSSSYTQINSMSITPGAGNYMVFFQSSVKNSSDDRTANFSIYVNGAQIAESEITIFAPHRESIIPISCIAYVTGVLAGEAIEVRWKTSGSTETCYDRTLIVYRVQ
ncbi:MAG: hypothetical protein K8R85_02140, partial [Bacteroidetes bacterium]|nr:hypothetical protein [Bacteroidota bacterium]